MTEFLPPLAPPDRPLHTEIATLNYADGLLKDISVAGAIEDYAAKAKDLEMLCEAVEVKIKRQAAYVVVRQDLLPPSQTKGKQPRRPDGIAEQLSHNLPAADPGADQVSRWRARLCAKVDRRWVIDDEKLADAIIDAQHRCARICEQEKTGTVRGTEGTGEFERYTPSEYVNHARAVLGEIDLDPATSLLAQETVKATNFYTEEDDGLTQDWDGRVWLNPPYHRELAPRFIDKLLSEFSSGRTEAAIVLTNNSTDTSWFRAAADACQCICFTTGRIHFTVPRGEPVMPTQGQAFFYFGPNADKFASEFAAVGFCLYPTGDL